MVEAVAAFLLIQEESSEKIKRKILRDHRNPLDLPESIFIGQYRLNKDVFNMLLDIINVHLPPCSISGEIQLAATLRFLAEGSYQMSVGNDSSYDNASRSEVWSCVCLPLALFMIYTFRVYLKNVYLSLKLTGPPSVPIMGCILLLRRKDLMRNILAPIFSLHGAVARIWVFLFPFFAVIDPEDLQLILSSKKHTNKVWFYRFLHNFLGNGLITSSGDKWHSHRRLLQPAFHLSILDRFIETFADASQALYEKLDPLIDQDINICKHVNNCVLDILNEAVLGVPIKSKSSFDMEHSPFREGKQVLQHRFMKPWLLLDGIYRMTKVATDELDQKSRLNEFTKKMIKIRRNLRCNNNEAYNKCLLDFMIDISEKNPDFTEDDIVNEACTFMLAGQDSVGASVAFTTFLLAQNPECQQKCHEELERIFGSDNRAPTAQDLREMRYLEMCIKESLRLYPSVPILARKLGEEVHTSKGTLPAGSNVFVFVYSTHRIPHIYPDPEKFDPQRFSPAVAEKLHPYAFLPFSAGPRYCIGNRFAIMEMKTVISRLLRSYNLDPVPGKTTFEPVYRITLRASGGLWLRLRAREMKMTEFSY